MPEKKEKNGMSYRNAPLAVRAEGPATLDEKTRSVEVVLSTENPALVYDWSRGVINEVLLMSGAQLPESRQLVLLDTHSRFETRDVIGSVRDIRIEDGVMTGRAYYSTAAEADGPWIKTKEGHLTDYSIGYRVDEAVWVPDGQTSIIDGRNFSGPLQVATKWTPRELSAVPVGADSSAKARSEIKTTAENRDKEETKMDPKLRKFLERCGLPVEATDEEAQAFMERAEPVKKEEKEEKTLDQARSEAKGEELERIREIDGLLERYSCQDMARDLIIGGKSLDEAQRKVLDRVYQKSVEQNPGFRGVEMGADEKDKFRAAVNDALLLRAGMTIQSPAAGAQDLRGYTLVEMARECLRMAGISHGGNRREMVGRALTNSDFPNILANIANKFLQQGWEEAAETWPVWCGTGAVNDFKLHSDNALSELDDLEEVGDGGEIKYGAFTEKKPETFKAATYAKKFRITRVMIINDDLGALTAMPAKRAEAAARKIGDVAYAVLIGNGAMGDTYAIFNAANHHNDAAGAFLAAPGVTNIAEGIRAIGTQKDIAGKRRLNIRPLFFLAPKALEGASEVFFRSERFSDNQTVATDSSFASTRVNPYSGNYFTRVYEPRLDDDSATAWYLMGPKGQTVKVVFLNGVQAPIMEMRQPGFTIEGVEYAVSVDAGAYAVDYRGMYRNEGTT